MQVQTSLDLIENGWFIEKNNQWKGRASAIEVKKVLHHSISKYQDILLFESTQDGNVLVLDGCVQLIENEEYQYSEMITHIPLFAHKNPKKILLSYWITYTLYNIYYTHTLNTKCV